MNPPVQHDAPAAGGRRREKRGISAALAISILIHAVILLELGRIILAHGVQESDPIRTVFIDTPPPRQDQPEEPQIPDKPDERSDDMQAGGPDLGTPGIPIVISSPGLSPGPPPGPVHVQTPTTPGLRPGPGPGPNNGDGTHGGGETQFQPSPFGGEKGSLKGYLYDLKQSDRGEKINARYRERLEAFVNGGWNPRLLNDVYRSRKPLYATQIFIPAIDAAEAPKAFQAKDVEPRNIIVLYTGTMTFPASGEFRLAGFGDDYLLVRINGKAVLDGSLHPVLPELISGEDLGTAYTTPIRTALKAGPWFHAEKGRTVPVEILLGEEPGGHFAAFVLFEQKGVNYRMRSDDPAIPALPVLQFTGTELPAFEPGVTAPDTFESGLFFGTEGK
jgi:hypothetical protein